MPVLLKLLFGDAEYDFELDPEDGVETLRLQVFSLTDVAPSAMELRLPNNELLHDGTNLACLNNLECVTLRRRAVVDDATKLSAAIREPPSEEAAAQVRAAATREMEQRVASGFQVAANYTDGRLLSIARRHLPWDLLLLPPPSSLLALGEMRASAPLAALAGRARCEPHRLGEELAGLTATDPSLVELVRSNQAAFRALLEGSAATAAVADAAECRHAVKHGWPPARASPDLGELRVLLRWFKRDFFSWVDQPVCEATGGATTLVGGGAVPTAEEARWGAARVELYQGPTGHVTRFARYNHPEMLLRTRRGRCGEWANAFGLLASAAGLEVRWVLDVTDHVWCEAWSESENRWVHCDPCEGVADTPLLYESGWRKRLSHVLAFGRAHCADVSRRYALCWRSALARRAPVPEG